MVKGKFLIIATLSAILYSGLAWAQLDPGVRYNLYENGVLVGEVFVEAGPPEAGPPEHWILYKNYQYPGLRYTGELQVTPIPSLQPYTEVGELINDGNRDLVSKHIYMKVETFTSLPR